jgi:phosphotransferase system enzyme I (PtsI)
VSRRLHGIAASPGVALGPVVVIGDQRVNVEHLHISSSEVPGEIERFRRAVSLSDEQLRQVATQIGLEGSAGLSIIRTHCDMLRDPNLIDATEGQIAEQRHNAEWSLQTTVEELGLHLEKSKDPYLRQLRSDIEFVGQRVLRNLVGWTQSPLDGINDPCVIVAHDLSPAETAEMLGKPVIAFVTEMGSKTSHTAIIARSLEIPAVVGLGGITHQLSTGDIVVVDGLLGDVVIDPDEQERQVYEARSLEWIEQTRALMTNRDLPAETTDGTCIELLANIEFPSEAPVAIEHGADGIGLYRSEFLYVNRAGLPSEEDQFAVYKAVVETLAPRPVTLRTFDIGGDKFVSTFKLPEELNPALGLRAVRLGLRLPEVLKTQLRAMLRAAAWGNLRIMFPMISGVAEMRACITLIEEAADELRQRGVEHRARPPIGCMIEVPSAVFTAEALAREVDFFSIGTNDLIQYTLAIDRTSEHVAHLYHPLHPAVIRAIDMVVQGAKAHDIPVGTCGAMAEEPFHALVLIGLGMKNLSMTPLAIPAIKHIIRSVRFEMVRKLAQEAMTLPTADEVERLVTRTLTDELARKSHLVS